VIVEKIVISARSLTSKVPCFPSTAANERFGASGGAGSSDKYYGKSPFVLRGNFSEAPRLPQAATTLCASGGQSGGEPKSWRLHAIRIKKNINLKVAPDTDLGSF
jgi:hypothetical protein